MIKLWLRFDEKNKFVAEFYTEHEPYMHVWKKDKQRFFKQIGREGRNLIIKGKRIKNFNFDGYRVFVTAPGDVATLKSFFAKCELCNRVKHVSIESKRAFCNCGSDKHRLLDIYFPESDVVYEKRWSVDREIRTFVILTSVNPNRVEKLEYDPNDPNLNLPELKRLFYDLETKTLDPKEEAAMITALSLALSANRVGFMGLKIDGKSEAENKGFNHTHEGSMISSVWNKIQDCDELIGFNSDSFDWPYLYDRAQYWRSIDNKYPYIPEEPFGFSRVDIQTEWINMRRLTRRTTPFTSLNSVLQEEGLGSKINIGEENPEKIRKKYPQLFRKYTKKDSQVLPMIADKTGIIDTLERRTTKQGIPVKHGLSTYYGIDTYILREIKKIGDIIAPSARHIDQLKKEGQAYVNNGTLHPEIFNMWVELKKFPGAKVLDPEVGIHDVVAICDFRSLYNTIMQAFNISFDTVAPPEMVEYDLIHKGSQIIKSPKPSDKVLVSPRPLTYEPPKLKRKLYFDTPNHMAFRKDRRGP
jgi:DNA polymerase elongation subunit (family B)